MARTASWRGRQWPAWRSFIDVEVDDVGPRTTPGWPRSSRRSARSTSSPTRGGRVEVVEENLDECVLCELCIHAAPPGTVRVLKLYDGTALER